MSSGWPGPTGDPRGRILSSIPKRGSPTNREVISAVRANVTDATRSSDWVNDFWKALAHDPPMLRRTWEAVKQTMAPRALDPLTKEMVYVR